MTQEDAVTHTQANLYFLVYFRHQPS